MRSGRRTACSRHRHLTYATVRDGGLASCRFRDPEEDLVIYSAVVKKRIRQAFDDVNNRRWDELMTSITPSCSPTQDHRQAWPG